MDEESRRLLSFDCARKPKQAFWSFRLALVSFILQIDLPYLSLQLHVLQIIFQVLNPITHISEFAVDKDQPHILFIYDYATS